MCIIQIPKLTAGSSWFIDFKTRISDFVSEIYWCWLHCILVCLFVREECSCHPVRYFTILSMQRSGSGWFETFLNSHPNISSNGEIFSVKVRRSNMTTITETLDTIYNLDWVSSASKNECTAAVGLKWMLNQVMLVLFMVDYSVLCFWCSFEKESRLF
jgi:hypothetical protein